LIISSATVGKPVCPSRSPARHSPDSGVQVQELTEVHCQKEAQGDDDRTLVATSNGADGQHVETFCIGAPCIREACYLWDGSWPRLSKSARAWKARLRRTAPGAQDAGRRLPTFRRPPVKILNQKGPDRGPGPGPPGPRAGPAGARRPAGTAWETMGVSQRESNFVVILCSLLWKDVSCEFGVS
jgi:hypothetical protein